MQEFLPVVKATLQEWAQLALGNPLFTASLILATALLASIVGMLRGIPIKRRAAASEKARAELTDQLAMTQQQAAGLQERLVQRNQQISGTVQALAAGFDVGEQPLPAVSEDLASEDLWQQHDRVVAQLANLLRSEQQTTAELQQSYQTERDQRIEKEAAIDNLQNTLAEKTLQITGLEQQVAEILEKHTAQSARLAELEQQWDEAKKQRQQLEEKLAASDVELSRLQKEVEARQGVESKQAPIHSEPVVEAEPMPQHIHPEPAPTAALVDAAFAHATAEAAPFIPAHQSTAAEPAIVPPPTAVDQAEGAQDQPQAIVLPDWDYQPEIAVPPKADAQTAASKGHGVGFAGKLKGMFGKPQPEPTSEPVVPLVEKAETARHSAAEIPPEVQPEAQPQPPAGSGQTQSPLGKVKNLFGRSRRPEPVAEEAVQSSEPPQSASEPEAAEESEEANASASSQLGKMKSLLGLSRQKDPEAKAEPVESRTAEHAAPAPVDAAESSSARSQMKKIKNLFGMAKG